MKQMSVYFETYQTVIQSIPTVDFSFGLTKSSFLRLRGRRSTEIGNFQTLIKSRSLVVRT